MNRRSQPSTQIGSGTIAGSPQVLLIGAGPVGMVLASELIQQGITVRIIDKTEPVPDHDPHSRAILVLPRTLELLRRIGVSERLMQAGRKVPAIRYYSDGRSLGTARLDRLPDTPYPFLLALPQRETERVLRQRLQALGGRIEQRVALEAFETDGERPRVLLRHAGGSGEQLLPDWLVGADGAASMTRGLLGTQLGGDPTDVTYVIADAPIAGFESPDAHYFYSRGGLVAIVPMRNGLYRIAGNVAHRDGEPEPRWRELLQDLIERRTRLPLAIGDPTYARLVRPRCGIAAQFRRGRCFLIGDAAHVITPAGGQGMNLGVQDAVNLGWKLGAVLRGELGEDVLDTYGDERRLAVGRTSRTTARIVRLAQQRTRPRILLRNAAFMAADRTGLVQRVLAPLLSQLDVDYGDPGHRRGPRRGTVRAGRRAPLFAGAADDPLVADRPALDLQRYTVVLWPGRRVPRDWTDTCARVRRQVGERARVLDLAGTAPPAREQLRRAFGRRPVIAVMRPDGHVAQIAQRAEVDAILQRFAGPDERRARAASSRLGGLIGTGTRWQPELKRANRT